MQISTKQIMQINQAYVKLREMFVDRSQGAAAGPGVLWGSIDAGSDLRKGVLPATGLRLRFVEVQSGCDAYWRVFLLSLLSMLMVVVMRVIPVVTGHSSGIIIFPLSTIITSNVIIAVIIILLIFFVSLISLPLSCCFLFPLSVLLFVCNDYYCL